MLRIDSNILWTIINLLILYALMKHFLFQPVHDILEKRKQEIESDFALANQQKQEALESKNKANQQLEKASLEYEQIIADANKKSDEMIEQARTKTIEAANEEKAKAKSEIADLINKAADKITNTKSDEKLYDDFLKEMK